MRLASLLAALPDVRPTTVPDVEITAVAYDSRLAGAGSMFVAVPSVGKTGSSGGFQFIGEAVARGAVAVVTESPEPIPNVVKIQVSDARAALADLACTFYDHPSQRMNVFAITGTDGKTTTSYLLDGIFAAAGYETGLIGTIETKIGTTRVPNDDRVTTPESLDLQRLLRSMVDAGVRTVSMEASSHALALQRLRGTRFAAAALTNITGDHVEFHGSWSAYEAAKFSLFTSVAADAPAILNKDDASFPRLAAATGNRVISYSRRGTADITARGLVAAKSGLGFRLGIDGVEFPVELRMPGAFNVSNALAAAGLAWSAGLAGAEIAHGLSQASLPPGRMERIECGQPFDIIVDYGHTVNAFRSVLSSLRAEQSGSSRLIAVFGAAGGRDRGKRPIFGSIARQFTDFFIITNEDPCGEDLNSIIADVASGVPAQDEGTRFQRDPDRRRAIRTALETARPGDTVVILGKGHERSIVMGGAKYPWSDVAVVRDVLEGRT